MGYLWICRYWVSESAFGHTGIGDIAPRHYGNSAGNLNWIDKDGAKSALIVDKLYATTISDNFSAIKVIEKYGFIKNPEIVMSIQLFIDHDI